MGYALYNENGSLLYWSYQTDTDHQRTLNKGSMHMHSKIPTEILNDGSFVVELIGGIHAEKWLLQPEKSNPRIYFSYTRINESPLYNDKRPGILSPLIDWQIDEQ